MTNQTVTQIMKVHAPPIKCQGIKTKLVPFIKQVVSWDGNGKWIEPFVGSGVVGFNILPKQALFCDSNPHIINIYNAIKAKEITPESVRVFLESEGKKLSAGGADYYYAVRDRFNEHNEPLDFLFLNRSCFNGLIRFNGSGKFNVPFGHKPNRFSPAYVTKIVNQIAFVHDAVQLNQWDFICQDFKTTIQSAGQDDFIYCDPPYIGRHVDYYSGWSEEHEIKLHQLLTETPARFVLSTWHSNQHRENLYIDSHWSDFQIITREHFYHVGASEENRKPMLEALVMNYEPENISDETNVPVQLAMFEKQKKYQTVSGPNPQSTNS